jgi:hypothetical protein
MPTLVQPAARKQSLYTYVYVCVSVSVCVCVSTAHTNYNKNVLPHPPTHLPPQHIVNPSLPVLATLANFFISLLLCIFLVES